MSTIHIYHPSKSVKGFACSFWAAKDGNLFLTILKQSGWDEKTQTGTFKNSVNDPSKMTNVKLSMIEAAAIIDSIEKSRPFSTFHKSEDANKGISFVPWMYTPVADEDDKVKPIPVHKGFSLTVSVSSKDNSVKNSFYIGLTFPEARLVQEFLTNYLHSRFNIPFSNEKEV